MAQSRFYYTSVGRFGVERMRGMQDSSEKDFEYKRRLGLDFNAKFSFCVGVSYPLPVWYGDLSKYQKFLWFVYRKFGYLMMILLFVSNLVMIFHEHRDIRVVTTCVGTMSYIICFSLKIILFRKHRKIMNGVLDRIQRISQNLDDNPVRDDGFFRFHEWFVQKVKTFGLGKNLAVIASVVTLGAFEVIVGFVKPEKRRLPMAGWFPYDSMGDLGFIVSCLFQLVSYLSFLVKDVAVDLIFLTILVSFNSYLIHLRKLLRVIVKNEANENGLDSIVRRRENIVWWIKQYQMLLRTIEDFKIVSNPYLFAKYVSVAIILFFGGMLVTSNVSYDPVQQMIVLSINLSNLLQLYIFSVMGDEITNNALKIAEDGFESELFEGTKNIRTLYFYTLSRSKKTMEIRFGIINPLSVHSFGQIVKMCFSYFTTVVQLRSQSTY